MRMTSLLALKQAVATIRHGPHPVRIDGPGAPALDFGVFGDQRMGLDAEDVEDGVPPDGKCAPGLLVQG